MELFASEYLERLESLFSGFDAAIEGLPVAALNWSPGPEMNSIAVLATHAAGATRYLIGDLVGREPSARVREDEFRATAVDGATLRQSLADVAAHSKSVVARLTVNDLEKSYFSPQRQREFTVAWSLLHALDHLAEHMAHAQLTRLLWQQQGITN